MILRWAYKKSRELARRMQSFRGDVAVGHPQLKPGSLAATDLTSSPVALSAPDISYTKEDDDAIDEYHRKTGKSCNHSYANTILKFIQSRRHGILCVYSSTAG